MTQPRLSISLSSDEERAGIIERASQLGMSVSEYIRDLCAADRYRPVTAAEERAIIAAVQRCRAR